MRTSKKKAAMLFYNFAEQFEDYTDEEFGKLMRAVIYYERDDDIPDFKEKHMKMAFRILKVLSDSNTEKYERICERNRENGRKGGLVSQANARKNKQAEADAQETERLQANRANINIKKKINIKKDIKKDIDARSKNSYRGSQTNYDDDIYEN